MANIKPLQKLFLEKEGGLSRNKSDTASAYPAPCKITYGGVTASDWHTNKGVTYRTFKNSANKLGYTASCSNFQNMPDRIWLKIMKGKYWDVWNLDDMKSDKIAWTVSWWSWGSGVEGARKELSAFLKKYYNINASTKTEIIDALNKLAKRNEDQLFNNLTKRRMWFYSTRSTSPQFEKGWKNAYNRFVDFVNSNSSKAKKYWWIGLIAIAGIGGLVYVIYKLRKK